MGYIYSITNSINGKKYVGQTTGCPNKRFKRHCRLSSGCLALKQALKKHGKDNFVLEILEEVDNKKLNLKEKFWIEELKTLSPNGYNLVIMAQNGKFSEETKRKMSKIKKGKYRGKDHWNSKTILCKNNNKIYYSLHEASRQLNLPVSDICSVLKGRRKHTKNYTFEYVGVK